MCKDGRPFSPEPETAANPRWKSVRPPGFSTDAAAERFLPLTLGSSSGVAEAFTRQRAAECPGRGRAFTLANR